MHKIIATKKQRQMEMETGWYWDWYIVGFFQCYRDNKVESELSGVRKCLKDEDGNIKKFIEGLGEETNNLKPDPHKWVPWIVFNDVSRNQLVEFFWALKYVCTTWQESHTSIQEESGTGPCSAPCKGANYIGLEGAFCKHFPDSCIKDWSTRS